MKKILLFFALAMFAVIGRRQNRPNSYQAYLDTLNMTYTGPLLAHQLHVIAMMVGIMPYAYDRYDDEDKFLKAFYDYPLVSSFMSRLADEVNLYVIKNAVFVEKGPLNGRTVPGCAISGLSYYNKIGLFPVTESAMRIAAEAYMKTLIMYVFPGKFGFNPYISMNSVRLQKKAQEALECGSLRKACSQDGFYDEDLACEVATHMCYKTILEFLKVDGDYIESVMNVMDFVAMVNALNPEDYGRVSEAAIEKKRKVLLFFDNLKSNP